MSSVQHAVSDPEVAVPFHLALVRNVTGHSTVLFELIKPEGAYDPVKQVWATPDGTPRDWRASSQTKCPGICGTNIGGIIVSERDTVSDAQ